MASALRLEVSSVTEKGASTPSDGNLSKESATSVSSSSNYRLGTAAMVAPNPYASVRASGHDPGLAKALASASPEHILSSDNSHGHSESAQSAFSPMLALENGNKSNSTSSAVKVTGSKGVPLRPNAREPKKTPSKHLRTDSNEAAVMPAKKRVRSNALLRTAPRATSTTTPGGLAGNSEFMYVYSLPRFTYEDSRLKTTVTLRPLFSYFN